MILVDTAVWTDHLHAAESRLVELLTIDEVGCRPVVIEEMPLGSIGQGDVARLYGRGLSAVDVHLIGTVALRRRRAAVDAGQAAEGRVR